MSSGDNGEAALVHLVKLIFVGHYCSVGAAALLIYDHAITLADEIDYMWTHKTFGVTVLFTLSGSLGLVLAFGMVLTLPPWNTNTRCDGTGLLVAACLELLSIEWAVFSALRVYAIGGQAWIPAVIVFVLSLVPFATNLYAYATASYFVTVVPGFGPTCMEEIAFEGMKNTILSLATRLSVIVADIIILVITWMKTYSVKRYASSSHVNAPLTTLLQRDGTLHFTLLLFLNLAQMLLNYYNVFDYLVYFVTVFTCIIVSHFLLNLRDIRSTHNNITANPSSVGTLQFASKIVGNMGASLSLGSPSQVDDLYGFDFPASALDDCDHGGGSGKGGDNS